ncbi:MAG: glycosyltransferase family 4 protein [Bacteroidota bacterium]|nr:glycosyltransferase family 4 protein [Bacteroidota bacterium]
MTICIATPNYLPDECGITTFNLHLSTLLVSAGHQVVILTIDYKSSGKEADEITVQDNGVTIVRLKKTYYQYLKKYTPYFQPGGFNAPNWISMGYAMREWLTGNKVQYAIDIIEASDYGGISGFLRTTVLPPVVITAHGNLTKLLQYNYAKEDDHVDILRELENIALQHADGIIAHSPLHGEELKKSTPIPVITTTIPFELNSIPDAASTTGDHALIVGGLQTIKGAFVMNASLRILPANTAIRVQWIGSDTCSADRQLSVAKKLSLDYPDLWGQSFEWLDKKNHRETLAFLASASFVIIPSLWEAFNYVALEAAAMGKAIIITDTTGAAHLFTHGENALIIPAGNEQALSAAIHQLATDKKRCKQLGVNARKLTEKNFSSGKIVEERIAFYTTTIERGTKASPDNLLDFIKNYLSRSRLLYYRLRKTAKKMIRRS